jgi:hypothetical protein
MPDIGCDRSYWPKCGTQVEVLPTLDLNDLWERFPDQTSVLVAEAIIGDPPHTHMTSGNTIETFIWSVGGDTLILEASLDELIIEYGEDGCRGAPDELRDQIAGLEKVEAAIKVVKDRIRAALETEAKNA